MEVIAIQLALFRERVTWPHGWRRGRYYYVTTRSGRLIGKKSNGIVVVRFRGKNLPVLEKNVRLEGQATALTDAVLAL